MHLSCGFSGFSAEVCCVMKLGNWVCTYNTRRAAPCGPLSRRSAWLCFPTPRLPPSLQVRSYTSGSSRHRFSPIEVCSQAVARAATAAAPPAPRACTAFLPRTATHRAHAACAVARYPPHRPALPPPRAVAAFPTPPRCPHIGRRSRPYRPRIFYLPRRGGRPTRRGALGSGPYDTRAPPRALDSDRHPAPPPPDATLPSPPLRAAGGLPVSRGLARRDADSVAHLRACRPRPPQVPVTAQAAAAAREEHGTTDPRGGEG